MKHLISNRVIRLIGNVLLMLGASLLLLGLMRVGMILFRGHDIGLNRLWADVSFGVVGLAAGWYCLNRFR